MRAETGLVEIAQLLKSIAARFSRTPTLDINIRIPTMILQLS
jgi:hypothetical protein